MIDYPFRPVRASFLLLSSLLVCLPLGCNRAAPPPPEEEAVAPVQAENPRLLILAQWTDLLGTTQPLPNRVARITAGVEGLVLTFPEANNRPIVAEGQQVKAGDVIARLDTRLIESRLKLAETAVRLAEVDVHRLDALSRTSSSTNGVGLVSPVEREKARLALEDAQIRHKAIQEEMQFYVLRAPISGRLGIVQIVPGQTVPVGTTVAEVVDLDEIDVFCFVPPHAAAQLKLDQPARLLRPRSDGKDEVSPVAGRVVYIALQAQVETGNFAVKVRFPNKSLELRGSTVVSLQVQTRPEEPRRTIPDSALMEDTDPPMVVVVQDLKPVKNKEGKEEEQGKARKLRARIGVRDALDHRVEILGLETDKKEPVPVEDNTLFIVKGGYGLQDGDKIKLEQEEGE